MPVKDCGNFHADEDDPCLHGQVVFDGFQFGDTVPEHKTDTRYGVHMATNCGWCLLYGNAQPMTRDNRRCEACSRADHGACRPELGCDCACVPSEVVR